MKRNEAVISVDAVRMVTNRIINIRTGAYYLIGTHNILIQGISKILPHRYLIWCSKKAVGIIFTVAQWNQIFFRSFWNNLIAEAIKNYATKFCN